MPNPCGYESTRGTSLFVRDLTNSAVWREVGAVEQMPELAPTAETDDCTDQYGVGDSGWVREYLTGKRDGGNANFTVNWISGNSVHDELYDSWMDGTERDFRLVFADVNSTQFEWPGLFTGWNQPLPGGGGKVTHAYTTKVNGKIERG